MTKPIASSVALYHTKGKGSIFAALRVSFVGCKSWWEASLYVSTAEEAGGAHEG